MAEDRPGTPYRHKALVLYAGTRTPHRSCGVAIAETFGCEPRPYQALRRGGVTGHGPCGAAMAGRLVLGEYLGDPSPTAPVTEALRTAMAKYEAELDRRAPRQGVDGWVCNDLVRPHGPFRGERRHRFCTNLAATVAEVVGEILAEYGVAPTPTPVRLDDGSRYDPQDPAPPPEAEGGPGAARPKPP